MLSLLKSPSPKKDAARELLNRRHARRSFRAFIERITDFELAAHHDLLVENLEAVNRGEIKRLMVFMPPGAAKSTYGSVLFPPFYLGANPEKSIITASYSQRLSQRFGKKCRNMVDSREYQTLFGFGLASDTAAKDEWETERGGEFTATSVDGSVTGRRGDLLLCDDPVKGRKEADSEVVREANWEWWKSDFRTRLKPGGAIVLIMTRWHEDDVAGRILPENYAGESGDIEGRDGEVWRVLSIQAEAEHHDPLGRKPGTFLWPEWFVGNTLQVEKVIQGQRNWSALYQQRPSPEEGNFFKRDWLRWYDKKPEHLRIYGASDYAVSDGEGDYTVHGIAGVDEADNLYILDWWRGQESTDVWIEAFIDLCRKWNPVEWGEEKGQIAKGLGPFITKRQQEERVYCYRKQFPSVTDKAARAQGFRGRMAQGKVYFPRNATWVDTLIAELMKFDAGTYDDQVDVCGLFGRMLGDMYRASVPKKQEEPKFFPQVSFDDMVQANRKARLKRERGC